MTIGSSTLLAFVRTSPQLKHDSRVALTTVTRSFAGTSFFIRRLSSRVPTMIYRAATSSKNLLMRAAQLRDEDALPFSQHEKSRKYRQGFHRARQWKLISASSPTALFPVFCIVKVRKNFSLKNNIFNLLFQY